MSDQPPAGPDEKRIKSLRTEYGLDREPAAGANYSAAGIELAMIVVVTVLAGWGLDRWLGTSPWFILILSLVGIFGGMTRLILRFK